jgi:alanine racemase
MIHLAMHGFFLSQPSPDKIGDRMKGYVSWLEVDLDNIGHNLDEIRRHTMAEVMPCVKNNAYGHGLIPVSAYLSGRGVKRVMVAKLREAVRIRDLVGIGVLCMDPLFAEEQFSLVAEKGITQTVYTLETAKALSGAASKQGKTTGVFVKVDTGLRRVGVWHEEAPDLIERISKLPNIRIEGVFSTLMQNPEQDREQLRRLLAVASELDRRGVDHGALSIASTDATLNMKEAHLDVVRPGMSLYGIYPETKDLNSGLKLRQALAFKARIEQVKWIDKGDSITYWGRFVATERMRVGTLHVGFYDGIPREMANKARIRVGYAYRRSLGSVSLNHILVDLTGTTAVAGDAVEVIGREGENALSMMAEASGWMTYSILNHLNPCMPRVYFRGGEPVAFLEP